jgi:uncharacterized protein (DUF1330 family)
MPAYIIANVKVTNPTQYEEYKKFSTLAMQAHGAQVCVRGGASEVLEGDWTPDRLVILKFPQVLRLVRIRPRQAGARRRGRDAHGRGRRRGLRSHKKPNLSRR